MSLDKDTVEKIAHLARLQLNEQELQAYTVSLSQILGLIEQMNVESVKLGEVARDGDQRSVMRQFVALGKTCRGCHTDFRKKKD